MILAMILCGLLGILLLIRIFTDRKEDNMDTSKLLAAIQALTIAVQALPAAIAAENTKVQADIDTATASVTTATSAIIAATTPATPSA